MPAQVRRVIVTGGATNIGRAITEAFLTQGARVAVAQLDSAVTAPLVQQYGDRVIPLQFDAGIPGQCREMVDAAAAALGGLDVLVNNAAITGPGAGRALADIDGAYFQRLLNVNVGGALFCSQAAVPHLRGGGGGTIIHLSSINAVRPQRGAMLYAASKAALSSLAQSMGKELASDGIRVVAVAPGDIATAASARLAQEMAARGIGSDVSGQTPLGQGSPDDIGAVVAFLCSPGGKFVTGTTWLVDGGLLA
jgi:3-oxoacyl-[acyl-carrier protein] reductase